MIRKATRRTSRRQPIPETPQEIWPEDHLGLIVIALRRWCRMRTDCNWRDTEEWSEALLGLVQGCQSYRAASGYRPSTWLVWTIRSRLRTLQISRLRRLRKHRAFARVRRLSLRRGYLPDRSGELRDWLLAQISRLPFPESAIVRRHLECQTNREISRAMNIAPDVVGKLRANGIAELRRRLAADW